MSQDKVIEILRKTNDGNNLNPHDLKLVEMKINGYLNETGEQAFQKLYHDIMNETPRWYFEVEGVTKDEECWIYWKGIKIEHFTYQNWEEEKRDVQELAKVCLRIESKNIPVTPKSYDAECELIRQEEKANTPE